MYQYQNVHMRAMRYKYLQVQRLNKNKITPEKGGKRKGWRSFLNILRKVRFLCLKRILFKENHSKELSGFQMKLIPG